MASSSNTGSRPQPAASATTYAPPTQAVQVIPNHIVPLTLRLDRNNFFYWRSQVLSTVRAHQLEGFLTGTRIRPPATIVDSSDTSRTQPNPEFADWIRLDQFLLSWLFNSISEGMLGHVARCGSSAELWSVLLQLFSNTSRARVLQLRGMLQSTKKGSTPIDEYILKMRCLGDALMAVGHNITDDELIIYILGGLGNEYDSAIVTLTSKESVSMQDVQFLLQTQEMRIEQQHTTAALDLHNPTANYAAAAKKGPSSTPSTGYNNNNRGRGTNRGRGGRNSNNRGGNRPICQVCGRSGHTALKCYHRFDLSFQGEGNSNNSDQNTDEPQAMLATANTVADPQWYLDSGASNHVTSDGASLTNKIDYKGKGKLTVGNGHSLPIIATGRITISCSKPLILNQVLYVPGIHKNLISISQLSVDNNVSIVFDTNICFVIDKTTKQVLLQGTLSHGLYKISHPLPRNHNPYHCQRNHQAHQPHSQTSNTNVSHNAVCNLSSINRSLCNNSSIPNLWHKRLGHPSPVILAKVLHSINTPFTTKDLSFCDACQLGKNHLMHFSSSTIKTTTPLQIIHSDVWGPSPYPTHEGYKYYILFVDDFTKYSWIYPMR